MTQGRRLGGSADIGKGAKRTTADDCGGASQRVHGVVTGYASINTTVETIQRGATDYMAKPFTPEERCATTSCSLKQAVA